MYMGCDHRGRLSVINSRRHGRGHSMCWIQMGANINYHFNAKNGHGPLTSNLISGSVRLSCSGRARKHAFLMLHFLSSAPEKTFFWIVHTMFPHGQFCLFRLSMSSVYCY